MAGSFAAAAKQMVRGAIEYFGDRTKVTVRRSVTTIDPVTELPTTVTTEETAFAVFIGVGEMLLNTGVLENQSLRLTDKRVFIPADDLTFVPDDNTKIIEDSVTYKVLEGTFLKPGSDMVYYDLLVREVGQ